LLTLATQFDTDYEEHEAVDLVVKGTIPQYAAGVLYRTGPLGFKAKSEDGKEFAANHWFDGFSCVHRFGIDFDSGSPHVTYTSRRTVDKLLEVVRKTGKLDVISFGAQRDPCDSFFQKVMSVFNPKRDLHNIGVTLSVNMPGGGYTKSAGGAAINGHTNGIETLHVKTDAFTLKKIDPVTLEPKGVTTQKKLHPELKGPLSGAHAKTDPTTGDLFNYNLEMGRNSTYRVFCTSASTGETQILATFPGTPAYLHSLFLTQNYVILCVWNSFIKWSGISILYNHNIVDSIAPFDPSSKATWYVVDRNGKGLVSTFQSDPFFCFHSTNAWEEPSTSDASKTDIICELSLYNNTDVIHRFFYDNLMSLHSDSEKYAGKKRLSCLPRNTQFRLPSVNAGTSSKPLSAELVFKADPLISMELPVINPAYLLRKHRYSYGVADRLKSTFFDGIVKFDNTTQTSIFWEVEAHTPGEPIFVADPAGVNEDDGVLLTVVLDGIAEKSYLLVLDARNLTELGKAEMRGPMSFGFHGTHKAAAREYLGDI
jgi:torulene dioxygenase